MLRDNNAYADLKCGQIIDTDLANSPISYLQAWGLCSSKIATDDLDAISTRDIKYNVNNRYTYNANMVIDNKMYQLKPEIDEASNPINMDEWELILTGAE